MANFGKANNKRWVSYEAVKAAAGYGVEPRTLQQFHFLAIASSGNGSLGQFQRTLMHVGGSNLFSAIELPQQLDARASA